MTGRPDPEHGLDKTLLKGLRVLELVSKQQDSKSLSQIANLLDLTRSNVHRTLKTLAHAGYVRIDTTSGHYVSTLKAFELGADQVLRLDARKLADPFMRQLRDDTGETVHLAILDGMDVVYIAKLEGARPIQAYTVIGGRAAAYAVATG